MRIEAHASAIRALTDLGPLRVWSVLVTVFGDLAPDVALDGPTLSAIMTAIGIKPEATRVALHRLRSDGWIVSEKKGRTILHSLTAQCQRDSINARPRIYGTPEDIGGGAHAVLMPDTANVPDPALFSPVAPRLYICAHDTPVPEGAMQLQPMEFPEWLGAQIETDALRDAYKALHAVLLDIETELAGVTLTALETAVLRVMIVHAWRRLSLKHPDLPRAAHSKDWRGHDCRALVTQLLTQYARPALDTIKAA